MWREPRSGYKRGIDYYNSTNFMRVLIDSSRAFYEVHGFYPDLVTPKKYTEKLFHKQFFGEFKVPEAGNKLHTSKFIPNDLKRRIHSTEIIWNSSEPELPHNNDLHKGEYYLKASHGSSLNRKITYPLSANDRKFYNTLCSKWLEMKYGWESGEWYYNVTRPNVLIEKPVETAGPSLSYCFYIINGQLGFIQITDKPPNNERKPQSVWVDENFIPLKYQAIGRNLLEDFHVPGNYSDMVNSALIIGSKFDFVRVDFIVDINENIYLLEMTFTPSNALKQFPEDFDLHLGEMWA